MIATIAALPGIARADTAIAITSRTVASDTAPDATRGRQLDRIQAVPDQARVVVVDRLRALFAALRSFDAGNFAMAEQEAWRVNEVYPADTVAMTIVGAARIKQGNLTGAVQIFKTYTDRYPLEAVGHFYLGLSYHLLGNREKAVENYWTALLLNPSLDAARANLGQLGGI